MAQWVRTFASHAEGWLFEFQPRQTKVKTGYNSLTAKRIIINGCPMLQLVWHAKKMSLLNSTECRTQVKGFFFDTSFVYVTLFPIIVV